MRRLIFALLLAQAFAAPAFALSGATPDGEDRFPFVVEINYGGQLICSGTVLYPRIVVTAAHCMQDKVEWRGGQVFIDHYLPAAQLSVTVTHRGKTETHDVADVTVSPDWRGLVAEPAASQRFAYDIALIITKEPIDVGLPPSLLKLADTEPEANGAPCPDKSADAGKDETAKIETLKGALQRLTPHGVVVAFGAESCSPMMCGEAGVR